METWSGQILRTMKRLKHYGRMHIRENNNLFYSDHSSLKQDIPAGWYRVWANEDKGIFINLIGAYIVFPSV